MRLCSVSVLNMGLAVTLVARRWGVVARVAERWRRNSRSARANDVAGGLLCDPCDGDACADLGRALSEQGFAVVGPWLTPAEVAQCLELCAAARQPVALPPDCGLDLVVPELAGVPALARTARILSPTGDADALVMGVHWAEPGAEGGRWHSDSAHLWAPGEVRGTLPPHALNVLIPLTGTPPGMGPAELRAGSHKAGGPLSGRPARLARPTLGAGDALVVDARLFRRWAPNRDGAARPVLCVTVGRPWYRQGSALDAVRPMFRPRGCAVGLGAEGAMAGAPAAPAPAEDGDEGGSDGGSSWCDVQS